MITVFWGFSALDPDFVACNLIVLLVKRLWSCSCSQ